MDVMHSSVYQTSLRERYNSLDGYYSVACQPPNEQRTVPLPRVSDSQKRKDAGLILKFINEKLLKNYHRLFSCLFLVSMIKR